MFPSPPVEKLQFHIFNPPIQRRTKQIAFLKSAIAFWGHGDYNSLDRELSITQIVEYL
jgi:hypothetical protein